MRGFISILAAVIVALAIGTWFGTALVASRINAATASNCASVNVLDNSLISILDRSFKALPSNSFYKKHPEELSKALRQTAQAVNELQAAHCSQ